MERLLLLWDELDEIVGYGRHLAVAATFTLTRRGHALKRLLRRPSVDFDPDATQVLN